jgi:chitinase
MKTNFFIYFIFITGIFTQEIPGQPVISWMETDYIITDSTVFVNINWDMWWGVNGNHWKLSINENIEFEAEILSNSPQAQNGFTTIEFHTPGQYYLNVDLCNGTAENEICHSSESKLINISENGNVTDEINHGHGVTDWGERFYSPYVDATGWPPFNLEEFSIQTGVKNFNLGFIVDRTGTACEASWGGYYGIDGWTEAGDFMFPLIANNEIANLRQLGGDIMVSIGGGPSNFPLASACTEVDHLVEQYQAIIDEYDLTHLDFDIEGIWVLDIEATSRQSQAIAIIQDYMENENRPLNIWFTLPVLPDGLTQSGLEVVRSALENNVELAGINIMTMDYGDQSAPNPVNNMGEYAIQAGESLHNQLTLIYHEFNQYLTADEIWQKIGITPMIGMNDVTTEIFNLEDAQQLREFGLEVNLNQLSIWSANRDKQCAEGELNNVDISCSSIMQDEFGFSSILNDFSENQGLTFDKNIVGYFVSWGVYDRDYEILDIPADKINFINYAFANINSNLGTIVLGDPYADIDQFYPGDCWDAGCLRGNFNQLLKLKEIHPHINTLISIGGWTWSTYFSDIALTEESREIFAQSCIDFILEYGFDGIDLDWEYPVSGGLEGNHHNENDKINLTALIIRIREMLEELTSQTGNQYYLTIAGSANPVMMENLELEILKDYLDWINIMSYDFHGPWSGEGDPVTNFNSPLYNTTNNPALELYNENFNLSASVQNYIDKGFPREQLHAGLAFYGRAFGGVNGTDNGLYANYTGPSNDGSWEDGVFDYYDLFDNYIEINGYNKYWHDEAKVPWLYNPNTQIMISYDDEESIEFKAEYILQQNLGGAMFWEFSGDRNGTLLNATFNTFQSGIANPPIILGDINLDGFINVIDIVSIVNIILINEYNEIADVNLDFLVDILDIVILVNQILGL